MSPSSRLGWKAKGVIHALAAAAAAATLGALMGGIGRIMPPESRIALATLAGIIASVIGGLELGSRLGVAQCNRETPHRWLYGSPLRWAIWNGAALGTGFANRIGFWLWYVVPAAALLSGDAVVGALIFGCYGAVRGLAGSFMIIGSKYHWPDDDPAIWLISQYPRVRRWAASMLMVVGLTVILVVGF